MSNLIIPFFANMGVQTTPPFTNTYSLDFDGMDAYVDTNSTKFSGASEFSISMWANFSSLSGNNPIVSNWFTGVTNYIVRYSSTKLQFYISTTGGVAKVTEYTFTPTLGIWYNIICVYNGSNISIYINGNPQGTPTAITGTVLANTNNCLIGERGTEHFSGIIDEVSYFNRALTYPTEITDISTTPKDLTSLSPVAWYRMGDNGSYKSPQWLLPNNENKDKVSNYSFEFDGLDDRVQLSSDFVASGEFTVSFWMKPVSAGTPNGEIYPIGTFPGNENYIKLDQISVLWLRLGATTVIFNEAVYGAGANNLVLNDWQNIVFIRDSSNVIRCYRNGVDFGYNVAAATNSNTLTLNSFGRIISNSFGFEGGLDEIAFWNSDETANLSTIYNGGEPTTLPSGAVAHYKMGEEATFVYNVNPDGTWTIPDQVGSNDGTSNNQMADSARVGTAPSSSNNALSFNMDLIDRVTDVPT